MKEFKMTFDVQYTETLVIYANSKEEALAKLHDEESYSEFQTIANMKYDATLASIEEV